MATTDDELRKIASLACINIDTQSTAQLVHDVSAIMDFIEQLRVIDTTDVKPLLNPLDLQQRLRVDNIIEESKVTQLASIAPMFEQDLYLVPKVIDLGK